MHINRIRCYHYNQAFTVPFDSLQTRRSRADSVIVRLDCDNNISGYGESAPRLYVTGEDSLSVLKVIKNYFAPVLFSHNLASIVEAADILKNLEDVCQHQGISAYHSALGAVDLALLDLLAQSGLLGAESPDGNRQRDRLCFSASVPFLPLNLIQDFFPLLTSRVDIKIIKILIDDNLEKNTGRVKLIRNLAGREKELRLEANGKLTYDQIEYQLNHLQRFDITAIEQPLPPGDMDGLQRLRQTFDMSIIADESLVSIDNARQLITTGAYDIFNIKVSKCGGLLRSKAIANLAAAHDIDCHVGTHVGETEFLGVAGRHLARSIPNFDAYGGGSPVLFSQMFLTAKKPRHVTSPVFHTDEAITTSGKEKIIRECRLIDDIRID